MLEQSLETKLHVLLEIVPFFITKTVPGVAGVDKIYEGIRHLEWEPLFVFKADTTKEIILHLSYLPQCLLVKFSKCLNLRLVWTNNQDASSLQFMDLAWWVGFWSVRPVDGGCKSDKTMGQHMKASQNCKRCCSLPVETFRPTTKWCYFGLVSEPKHAEDPTKTPLDPLTYLKKQLAPTPFSDIPIGSPKSAWEANHFLTLERWDLYIQGRTGAKIMDILREHEPEFYKDVQVCVELFAAYIILKLTKVDNEVRAAMGDYVGQVVFNCSCTFNCIGWPPSQNWPE